MDGRWGESDDGLSTHLQEGLLDPVVLDHAVAAQVRDQFGVGRAGAAPRHACVCDCPGIVPEWRRLSLLMLSQGGADGNAEA